MSLYQYLCVTLSYSYIAVTIYKKIQHVVRSAQMCVYLCYLLHMHKCVYICRHKCAYVCVICYIYTNVRIFALSVTYAGHYHSLHMHILRWRLECGYAYTHVSCAKNCHDIVPRILTYIHIYTSVNVYMCIHLYIYILYIHVNIRIS